MIKKSCTKSQILSKITDYHIFKLYCKNFIQVDKMFYGDINRSKREKLPSANITYGKSGLYYHDFGKGITLGAIDYVMVKYNLSFQDALDKIDVDFGLGFSYNKNISYHNTQYNLGNIKIHKSKPKSRSIIKINKADWSDLDMYYWQSNAWTIEMLRSAKIVPINSFFLKDNDGSFTRFDRRNELAYSYEYYTDTDGIFQRKIYSPERKKFGKWFSNINRDTIQGWDLFPKVDEIGFIQSAFKDLGSTWRIFNRPVGLAPNNEGSFLPEKIWYKIKQRRKKWILFFDNDEAGIENAIKYSQMYKIPYIHMPFGGPKDPSDWVVKYGLRSFNYYLQRSLNETNI